MWSYSIDTRHHLLEYPESNYRSHPGPTPFSYLLNILSLLLKIARISRKYTCFYVTTRAAINLDLTVQ